MLLAALALLLVLGCGSAPTPAKMPELPNKVAPSRITDAIQGVWALEELDGRPAKGWVGFAGTKYDLWLGCGSAYGTFAVTGDIVTVDAPMSVAPNCSGPNQIDAPTFIRSRFRVQVDEQSLVASAIEPRGDRWARYRRSSIEATYPPWFKRYRGR